MSLVFFIGILIVAVIAAEILYNQYPVIPLAFYQIAAGIALSFITFYHHYQFDPKMFLFAIIAPIMFNDAQETSNQRLGRNLVDTLSLAVLLVITTVIIVGFGVNWIYPAIALPLAFMLISIVSPTDATAVSSITKNLQLPSGLMETLKNESLFNDASGIVAFDLALTAFSSGNFSAAGGIVTFLETFFGGILVGAILGWGIVALRIGLIHWNIDNASTSVPIQLITPFLVYYVAEELGVSGILAVVAAGLIHGVERNQLHLTSTKMQVVSTSVWELLTRILNGFVFVLLGVSLPTIIDNLLTKHQVSILILLALAVGIYVLMIAIRFLWMRRFLNLPFRKDPNQSAALLALSGVHGTVTLAMAFSLPLTLRGAPFPMRNELIFISAIIILISLVVPLVTIPFILPKQDDANKENFEESHQNMFDYAIAWLKNNEPSNPARHSVIETLFDEKGTLRRPDRQTVAKLFDGAAQAEADAINDEIENGSLTPSERQIYRKYLLMITSRQANSNPRTQVKLRLKFVLIRLLHPQKYRKAKARGRKMYQQHVKAYETQADETTTVIEPPTTAIRDVTPTKTDEATPVSVSAKSSDLPAALPGEEAISKATATALTNNDEASTNALIQVLHENPHAARSYTQRLMQTIERLGNDAAMQWLFNQNITRDPAAINAVRDSYIKRSKRFSRDQTNESEQINAIFLSAFQAEYQYIQDALSAEEISLDMAKALREQVSYDQMVYMKNAENE
ncbi:MAG TPA: sodium:proton antiporter [Lactobacillus sp.]|nr:sodium:proton antiporter [Lactobacillus sp.]